MNTTQSAACSVNDPCPFAGRLSDMKQRTGVRMATF